MEVMFPKDFYEATIALSVLTRDPKLQVREKNPDHQQVIEHYRKLYADGMDLGPLMVVEEINEASMLTGRMLLADGFLRAEALLQLGQDEVSCVICRGDSFTALLIATRENGIRGLQFSQYDRKYVTRVLLMEVAKEDILWSTQALTNQIGIDRATVRGVRDDLKKRRGLVIPDATDEHKFDEHDTTPSENERLRYDPNVGFIPDPLLDNLPGADEFIPPSGPKRGKRGKKSSGK